MATQDLTGRLVRWENDSGAWLTARVEQLGFHHDLWSGVVVDPGNYRDELGALTVGQWVPSLLEARLTVIPERAATS